MKRTLRLLLAAIYLSLALPFAALAQGAGLSAGDPVL
jgi:hypothetical protein